MSSALARVEALLFNPDRRVAGMALAAMLLGGVALTALLVGVAGPILSLAAFAALVGGLLMLSDLRWALVVLFAVIGLLPFGTLPLKLGFTPTFLDLALLVLYMIWLVRLATRRQRELVGSPLGIPVMLFFLLTVFAFANGLRYNSSTVTTVRNFAELGLGVLFFFLLVNNLNEQGDLDLMTRAIILAGGCAAAIAVIFYFIPSDWTVRILDALVRFNYPGGAGALRYIEDDPANPMRAIGTQIDPNVLGGFMILTLGLTAPQLVSRQPLFRRIAVGGLLGVQFFALYLTYSRGSLLGIAGGLLLVGLLRYRRLLLIGVGGAALLLLLPQAQAYVSHLVAGLQLQDQATLMRLGEYRDALTLIGRYPWFGVGFTGSPDADLYVGVSSLYLLMAEEMGAIGVAVFAATILGFFASLWRIWRLRITPRMEALVLGLVASVMGVVIGGFLDHYLFNLVYPHMTVLFWAYLGLGMSAIRLAQREVRQLARN